VHLHYTSGMKSAFLCSTTVGPEQIIIIIIIIMIVYCNLIGTKRYSNWSRRMSVTLAVSCWIPISIIIMLLLSSALDERVRHSKSLIAKRTINLCTTTISTPSCVDHKKFPNKICSLQLHQCWFKPVLLLKNMLRV